LKGTEAVLFKVDITTWRGSQTSGLVKAVRADLAAGEKKRQWMMFAVTIKSASGKLFREAGIWSGFAATKQKHATTVVSVQCVGLVA
jgi:hypothetical protein